MILNIEKYSRIILQSAIFSFYKKDDYRESAYSKNRIIVYCFRF